MRYKKNLNEFVKLRISLDEKQKIHELCKKTGLDESKLIRYAIAQLYLNEIPSDFYTSREKILKLNDLYNGYLQIVFTEVKKHCKRPLEIPFGLTNTFVYERTLPEYCSQMWAVSTYNTPELLAKAWDQHYVRAIINDYLESKKEEKRRNGEDWNENDIENWTDELKNKGFNLENAVQ
jgi:predicted DNA-binding protein